MVLWICEKSTRFVSSVLVAQLSDGLVLDKVENGYWNYRICVYVRLGGVDFLFIIKKLSLLVCTRMTSDLNPGWIQEPAG